MLEALVDHRLVEAGIVEAQWRATSFGAMEMSDKSGFYSTLCDEGRNRFSPERSWRPSIFSSSE